ncbi:hypothetical protein LSM04_002631 [Trypanosoma melophagium]|uniref:uncharacterized protein n=1 Tax=Trypanosoma melophagium TaxID=715481 RepID=UPI00351A2757|nr:hypothetical protein LSM04_002631 [Trypanosoma melophagium]
MIWCSAARAGDIGSLHAEDVRIGPLTGERTNSNSNNMARLTMTMRRASPATPFSQRMPNQRLLQDDAELRNRVRQALRNENPPSALPSIRKGATRHLAAQGVSEEEPMHLTGHTRADTLQRYLDYGLQLTREAETAQDNAARALLERNS